jgi:hypothetical protein
MSLPPQPPSSEEPEQHTTLHFSEETPKQASSAPESRSDEVEKQPVLSASEDIPTQYQSAPDESEAPTQVGANASAPDEAEAPTQVGANTSAPDEAEAPAPDEAEAPASNWAEAPISNWDDASTPAWTDASPIDDPTAIDDTVAATTADAATNATPDFNTAQGAPAPSQTSRAGIFIHKSILIAAAIVVVLAAILVALVLFLNRPIDPPTDWIASESSAATTTGASQQILYYLHWTNQDGKLTGQLQLAADTNGTPQSLTAPTTGLYNRDNHIIYVVVTISGSPTTLTGKIDTSNNTLTLNPAGATDTSNQIVFHTGSANDYKLDTQKMDAPKK